MKTVVAIALAVTSLTASSASAQGRGMECSTWGGQTTCKESAAAQAERLNRENLDRMSRMEISKPPTAEEVAAARTRKLQKKVAAAVKAGRCDEAKQLALDAGDLDTADKAMRLCTPAS